jgi:hypothetical protein
LESTEFGREKVAARKTGHRKCGDYRDSREPVNNRKGVFAATVSEIEHPPSGIGKA